MVVEINSAKIDLVLEVVILEKIQTQEEDLIIKVDFKEEDEEVEEVVGTIGVMAKEVDSKSKALEVEEIEETVVVKEALLSVLNAKGKVIYLKIVPTLKVIKRDQVMIQNH